MERPGHQSVVVSDAEELAAKVMDAASDAGELLRPGRGLDFSIELTRVEGLLPPLDAPEVPGDRHGA